MHEAAKQRRPDNVPSVWAQPRVEALRARTVELMGDGRIRAASNNVDTIAGLLEGKAYAEPLTGAALQQRIDILHPDSNEMDLLPPVEDDPPAEPLQITPDQLRQHLYGLSFDSAAGNTGWTNSMLYALCNDRTTPAFQAGQAIISAFCAPDNRMTLLNHGLHHTLIRTSSPSYTSQVMRTNNLDYVLFVRSLLIYFVMTFLRNLLIYHHSI